MIKRAHLLFFAAALGLVLTACGKSPEDRAAEAAIKASTGADATVQRDGNSTRMTMQTDQGALTVQSGEGLRLPADFPGDVYLPSGYKLENVTRIGPMHSVVLGLPGQSAALSRDITAKMQASGWTSAMTLQTGDQGALMSFTKAKRAVTYSLAPGQAAGQLTLSVQHTADAN